ncbi:SH3 domain-containing protein [Bernardetia sp. OM2101]|uniref:SH3 domain-containing protein n=1 Tax=Bernardetia sp. OM2101 TaxID=3344876 RepID=UPI0035D06AD3
MKSNLLFYIFLFFSFLYSSALVANSTCFVTAENGLIIRENPSISSKVLGKFEFGTRIHLSDETEQYADTLLIEGKQRIGYWVKISTHTFSCYATGEQKEGFVFNIFLDDEQTFVAKIQDEFSKFTQLKDYQLDTENDIFCLKGDFLGDKITDTAILLKRKEQNKEGYYDKNIVILNYNTSSKEPKLTFLSEEDGYEWVGVFVKINAGTPLWSNYDEDWIDFDKVPEKDKVFLTYDCFLLHAAEACGGNFTFWKDNKFNYLQQE